MQDAVRSGEISAGHARSLLGLQDADAREKLFRKIIAEGLSVRQTEAATQEGLSSPGKKKKKGGADRPALMLDPDLGALKEMMIERLGTKVEITGNLEKGRIAIDYFTSDDLQRILEVMGAVNS
jgi:ParB family chromosome partitioning protein